VLGVGAVLSAGTGNVTEWHANILFVGVRQERIDFTQGVKIVCVVDQFRFKPPVTDGFKDEVAGQTLAHVADMDGA